MPMNLQETYSYLLQIRKKEYAIKRKLLRCEELRSCMGVKAIRYDKDCARAAPSDRTGEIICKIVDLEGQIERLKQEKALLIIEIGDAIEQLPDDNEKTVLTEFFIGHVPMVQVARIINYSIRRTYHFRKQGVIHLGNILGGPGEAPEAFRQSRQTLQK